MNIKREEVKFPSVESGQTIYGEVFYPSGEIKGILQFAHGMSDYGARYGDLFEMLAQNGYVAGYSDHLGHGYTASSSEDLGYIAHSEGYKKLIGDFSCFYDILDEKFPNVPHFVMGHSMGSFIVRCFLVTAKPQGAIVMGTGKKNPLADLGIVVAKLVAAVKGERYRSKLLMKLCFGSYNKKIKDSNHLWAWLSYDKKAQQNIVDDEKRNKFFTASAFQDLFYLVKYANADVVIDKTPKDLPIIFISGSEDPLGPYEDGINTLCKEFKSRDFSAVDAKIFPNCRHELCHEIRREEVFEFILQWLNKEVSRVKK
ncbi:MAG: alpha/beta hydrolase [Clostridiales bacterium]